MERPLLAPIRTASASQILFAISSYLVIFLIPHFFLSVLFLDILSEKNYTVVNKKSPIQDQIKWYISLHFTKICIGI